MNAEPVRPNAGSCQGEGVDSTPAPSPTLHDLADYWRGVAERKRLSVLAAELDASVLIGAAATADTPLVNAIISGAAALRIQAHNDREWIARAEHNAADCEARAAS